MTLKEKIQAKIDSHKAEIAILEAHLAEGGTWLEQEEDKVEQWLSGLIDLVKAKL